MRPREGALTLVALVVLTLAPALSLTSARWVERLELVPILALASLLLGVLLARSSASGFVAHLFALGVGETAAVVLVASTLPTGGIEDRLLGVVGRVLSWYATVRGGGMGTDNLLFLLLLAGLAWFVGYFSAWSVYRDGVAWWAIIANGAALMVNLAYHAGGGAYALAFLGASMVLLVRMNLLAHEERWLERGLRYTPAISEGVLRAGVAAAAVLVAVAWLAPPVSAQQLGRLTGGAARPIREAQVEFGRLFGGVTGRNEQAISGFNETMQLRGNFNLPTVPVLEVRAPEPRYWRAITYQRYTGQGWAVSDSVTYRQVLPGDEGPTPYRLRKDLPQTMKVLQPRGNLLIAAAAPKMLSTAATMEVGAAGRRTARPLAEDQYTVLRSARAAVAGQEYGVVSSVTVADEASLRQAGESYPDWVQEGYLGLPPMPERVRQLARQLAQGATTPYDRARAVEAYLRTLPYSLEVDPPPAGVDGVEYFLFTAKTGYCDYFASAMTVMLRSVGVPARVASGYAVGEPQSDGSFLVRDANAHSWVEVYFPRYGWVEFEPSAIRPPFQRPRDNPNAGAAPVATPTPAGGPAATPTPAAELTPRPPERTDGGAPPGPNLPGSLGRLIGLIPWGTLIFLALALAALVGAGWLALNWGTAGMSPAEAHYTRMGRLAGWLGRGQRAGETPREYARALGRVAPTGARDAATIAEHFSRRRFGRAPRLEAAAELARAWRGVRGQLLRAAWRLRGAARGRG